MLIMNNLTLEEWSIVLDKIHEVNSLKHSMKMEEINFERDSSDRIHDQIIERNKIKFADEQKLRGYRR